jgi:hypothetical protein
MNLLMASVFTFFGIHTLLWLSRSLFDRAATNSHRGSGGPSGSRARKIS